MLDTDCDEPNWEAGGRVHNWRSYISEDLKAMWHTFTIEQKRAISDNADAIAEREHWD